MLRVAFLIRSLHAGGAERQLVQLVAGLDKSRFDVTVITFYGGGAFAAELAGTPGVTVVTMAKEGRLDVAGFLWRLVRTARAVRPHILHGYMPGANELASLVGRSVGARVVWGLRASDVDLRHYDRLTTVLFRAGRWLSASPDLIIANSEAGRRHHVAQGYHPDRMIVIPNGVDVDRFRPDPAARARLRAEWQVPDEAFVVGTVARLDPMKDHGTFLRAAAGLAARLPDARFVIAGAGEPAYQRQLAALADELGVAGRVRWLGVRTDTAAVYNALDTLVSASAFGEGFSNVLGEAMATEVPCVVTDVGDAAAVIADTGRVVARQRPDLLADALAELAAADRAAIGRRARRRIADEFSTRALVDRTTEALAKLVTPAA